MALTAGETVGDYQIVGVLGAGGMGTVYQVRHLISDRLEAMKLALPELSGNPELAERFNREIKLQARLSHPNIASLHTAFRAGNQLFMVMELVEGQTLHATMRQVTLDPVTAIKIAVEILTALEYAHGMGIVHRDIKPANIMMTTAGQIKIMDFGIARSMAEERHLTQTGAALGSAYYMSPEQVQGLNVDSRTDLYSVGVLLYELTTGVRPVTGENSWSVMNGHVHTIPRSPSSVRPGLPEALAMAILKALEKKPEDRFQNAALFRQSLEAVASRVASMNLQATITQVQAISAPPVPAATTTPVATVAPTLAPTPTPSTAPVPRFDAERLQSLTRELAVFVGPMARVLVNQAAKKAKSLRELYDSLAQEIPEGVERKQFLSKRP